MSSTVEPLRGLKIGVMPFGTFGQVGGRRQDLLDRRRAASLLRCVDGRAVVARPGRRDRPPAAPSRPGTSAAVSASRTQWPTLVWPWMPPSRQVGRAGPHLGGLSAAGPSSSTMNLLCWMSLARPRAGTTLAFGDAHLLDHARGSRSRGKAPWTLPFLSLGSLTLASTISRTSTPRSTRLLERLGHGLVAELVEAAEQRVARAASAMNFRIASSRSRLSHPAPRPAWRP